MIYQKSSERKKTKRNKDRKSSVLKENDAEKQK